jgi:Ca2+-binding RTX toxin-like protein
VDLSTGKANGPDNRDTLSGIEDVAGSSGIDKLTGSGADNRLDGGPGDDAIDGGGGTTDAGFGGSGNDTCQNVKEEDSCENGQPAGPPATGLPGNTSVELDRGLAGDTLVITGNDAASDATVGQSGGGFTVSDPNRVTALEAHCSANNPAASTAVTCVAPDGVDHIIANMGGGDDRLAVDGSVPGLVRLTADGGHGDDTIRGGNGNDTLQDDGGKDTLEGGNGDDGLVAGPGPDELIGGQGADLMVANDACNGTKMSGGDGTDNASFARVPTAVDASLTTGSATDPARGGCSPDQISNAENLEGSFHNDKLVGDGGGNSFYGQDGNDVIEGLGGGDFLDGVKGSDTYRAGPGKDTVFAIDGQRDKLLDCGPGGSETVGRDRNDPKPKSC